jgi:nucleoside-diphosphate-sugar epimerase
VTAVDLHPNSDQIENVRYVSADASDAKALHPALDGADIVYHLAYLMGEEANRAPVAAARINAVGGTGLLQNCLEAGVKRVLLASSVTVFGSRHEYAAQDLPLGDGAAKLGANGIAIYGAGKVYMELVAGYYARQQGLLVSGLRPGAVIGASRNTGRAKTVANIVATALSGETVEVALGKAAFQAIHIDDVVGAFMAMACSDPAALSGGRFFNLAGDYATMRSFCDEVAAQLPGARFDIADGDSDELFGSAPFVLDDGIYNVVGYTRRYRTLREAIAAEIEELRNLKGSSAS